MIESLLTTKLYIPPPHPNLVPRPRLVRRLEEGLRLGRRLTLLSAPAGYGKSTLLSAWIHGRGAVIAPADGMTADVPSVPLQMAWLSLDRGDNELWRFLAYLVGALRTIPQLAEAGVGGAIEAVLQSTDLDAAPALPVESLLTGLINEIAGAGAPPFLLVLDDLHAIDNSTILEAISYLVDHLPPPPAAGALGGVHLVLASRSDPPWPLARLRARGGITELRADDLRFTREEALAFVRGAGSVDLAPEDVALLRDRTEGWIAGLQMAALALQGHARSGGAAGFIESFRGTHRYVLDYLVEEVLGQQPPALRAFLVQTSILERMTGSLCDAVRFGDSNRVGVAKSHGAAILAQLERANLFVVPLDDERQWYRYHSLFADLLQSTLRQSASPDEIRELQRRASQWHQERGLLEEAVRYALAAQEYERAASILEENLLAMLYRSGTPTFLGWLEQLPQSLVDRHPWIDIYRAWTFAHTGQLERAEALLQQVEERLPPGEPASDDLLGSIAAARAYVAHLRGELDRSLELAHRADELLLEENLRVRASVAYTMAETCLALDDIEGAGHAWNEMVRLGERARRPLLTLPALCNLANVKKVQGRLHDANALYETVYQRMIEQDALASRVRMSYEMGLADLLYEWNDLEAAREHVTLGLEYCLRFGVYLTHVVLGHLILMRVLQAQGESAGALDALKKAQEVAGTSRIQRGAVLQLETGRVRQWLAMGDLEAAVRWADAGDGCSEPEQIARARVRLAQGRAGEALSLLAPLDRATQAGGRAGRRIEVLLLRALAQSPAGEGTQGWEEALAALGEALALAGPEGYARTFLDEGAPMERLLRRAAAQGIAVEQAAPLLDALRRERASRDRETLPSPASGALYEPLTDRELEVLRLLAAGASNKEIAQTLVVAASTVKQHLKNLYAKLDVHSRTQAVARGRELEIL